MKIELVDIQKSFGSLLANDGISLTLEPGTIHGLLGENGAGKTTLMKCLSGYLSLDGGLIKVDGVRVRFGSPAQAIQRGIGMLHQDPLDFPQMSVLDNFLLASSNGMLPDRRRGQERLRELGVRFQFDLDPESEVGSLTVGERQQLEILRLLSLGVRVLILDEPTTGISLLQKAKLFEALRDIVEQEGYSVVFVSHKLEELEALCDRVTVLRRGRVAGQVDMPHPLDELVEMMFGHPPTQTRCEPLDLGPALLSVEGLTISSDRLMVKCSDLHVREGEVIGLAGLEGSGQQSFLRACAGLAPISTGRVLLNGRDLTHAPYHRFLQAGVAYAPSGRLEEGLIAGLTLTEHFAVAERRKGFLIDWTSAEQRAARQISDFGIAGEPSSCAESLSGGNQQRVVLALLPPGLRLLLMEHPTRGLDVESAGWIWQRLLARRQEGTAVLFTSADLDELLERSDRIAVFYSGQMSAPLEACNATVEQLAYLIAGKGIGDTA